MDRFVTTADAFRAVVEHAPVPMFVHRRGVILYANPAWLALLGHSGPADLVGRTIFETFVPPDEREKIEARVRQSLDSDAPLPPIHVSVRRRDGKRRTVESVSVRVSIDDEPAHLVIAQDITDRLELQARLMLSDRMASLGTLAAGIAHEINNPLAYVMGNLESIAEELRAVAGDLPAARVRDLRDAVAEARDGAERVRRIVRSLRTLSRADEERRAVLDVRRVIESAIDMSFNEIRHRARLVKDFGQVPPVEADEARLGQVFINLLVNAAQAIPEGHAQHNEIRVTTSTDASGRAVAEVRDTGGGIPDDLRDRVFDPFFTTKPIGSGTGLGLAICHGIVTGLGGAIEFTSSTTGTAFRVVLPASDKPLTVAHSSSRKRAPRRGRVLVIDDDPLVGASLQRTLVDHDVEVARSGNAALELLERGDARFDIILCDLMMPETTGMELHARLVRSQPAIVERIVFMTGGAFTPAARAFLDQVPNARLEKPFDARDVRALVNAALR